MPKILPIVDPYKISDTYKVLDSVIFQPENKLPLYIPKLPTGSGKK